MKMPFFKYITSSIMLVLFTSCAMDELQDCQLLNTGLRFTASLEDGTKVALDGVSTRWTVGDQIFITQQDGTPLGDTGIFEIKKESDIQDGGKVATFTGEGYKTYIGQKAPEAGRAVYPASAVSYDATTGEVSYNLLGAAGDDDGTIKSAVMLGKTSGTSISFTNVCAILKFNTGFYGETEEDPVIKKVVVSAKYGSTPAPLVGAFTPDWSGTPSISAADGASSSVTINIGEQAIGKEKDVYIPIFPLVEISEVKPTFTLTLYGDGDAEILTKSKEFTASAGVIKNIGAPERQAVDLSTTDFLTGAEIAQTTANCYVVRENGLYEFPLVYGNAITGGVTNSDSYANGFEAELKPFMDHTGKAISTPFIIGQTGVEESSCSASVLWTDKAGMISDLKVVNHYIRFKVNSLDGNAVIQLKSGGKVLWSWHIWATSLPLAEVDITTRYDDNYKILNYNIGAVSGDQKGTYYQWGRRDAFPNTPQVLPDNLVTTGPVTVQQSFDGKFVSVPDGDWCAVSYYNNWNTENAAYSMDNMVVKTIYDPSPAGYTVPRYECFTGFTDASGNVKAVGSWDGGWHFKRSGTDAQGVYFPTTGFRNYDDGNSYNFQLHGFYSLSSPGSAANGKYLYFASGGTTANTSFSYKRAQGVAVRPQKIQERVPMVGTDLSKVDFLTGSAIAQTTANCYVIRQAGTYKFPLVYGNGITKGSVNADAYRNGTADNMKPFMDHNGNAITSPYILEQAGLTAEDCTAKVLWTTDNMISETAIQMEGSVPYIYFKANNVDCNAVIQLRRKSDGAVLWSWHIWATSLPLAEVDITTRYDDNYKILNYNIGAISGDEKGTYYQWGRRDAFYNYPQVLPANLLTTGPVTLQQSFNGKFVSVTDGDWCTVSYYNNWNTENAAYSTDKMVVKTIYDPSPAGFTVPRYECFTGFTDASGNVKAVGSWDGGWHFKRNGSDAQGVYFPTTGYRSYQNGNSYNFQIEAFYSLSSPGSADNGKYLYFASGNTTANTGFSYKRAHGVAVRPQKEEVKTPMSGPDLSFRNYKGETTAARNTANCYVINQAGTYKFPLVYGNGITNGSVNANAYKNGTADNMKPFMDHTGASITSPYILTQTGLTPAECTVSVLWQDKDRMIAETAIQIEDSTPYVFFRAKYIDGNAVIQLKRKSDGAVLWSWHIWATSLPLDEVDITNADGNTYTILNYNIGAVSGNEDGTYYQWGRKDAFKSGHLWDLTYTQFDDIWGSFSGGIVRVDEYGPESFYGKNWCKKDYLNIWDTYLDDYCKDEPVEKTIYDPSPAGFTVPRYNCFSGFVIDDRKPNAIGEWANGWHFLRYQGDLDGVFFPATGYWNSQYNSFSKSSDSRYALSCRSITMYSEKSGGMSGAFMFKKDEAAITGVYGTTNVSRNLITNGCVIRSQKLEQ